MNIDEIYINILNSEANEEKKAELKALIAIKAFQLNICQRNDFIIEVLHSFEKLDDPTKKEYLSRVEATIQQHFCEFWNTCGKEHSKKVSWLGSRKLSFSNLLP